MAFASDCTAMLDRRMARPENNRSGRRYVTASDVRRRMSKRPSVGGTTILIMVGVVLDTMKQIEGQLVIRHYEGFMKEGTLRGRK